MSLSSSNRQETIVRAVQASDLRRILHLVDTAWRVYLRISPLELRSKINLLPTFVAEDKVGLRGFMMIEPLHLDVALIIGAGLRDSWNVKPYLDLLLPVINRAVKASDGSALVYIGNSTWLIDELAERGFEVREWIMTFERTGVVRPSEPPPPTPAVIRTAHYNDLPALLALDKLAFGHLWHKSGGNFSEALAKADSFAVAILNSKIVAYEWCEVYGRQAHLTRLAVHPDYQGQGLGSQLLYRAITDALERGCSLITLNTQENNFRSQALYQRFGFVYTKQRIPVLWKALV